ncbi:hypothetical protein HY251_08995 [bacterium]|nr:hypothetical protein [bacterium]
MTEQGDDTGKDSLDALLERARTPVPAGLAERLIAAAASGETARRFYWIDVAFAARTALRWSAAGLLVAAALAGASVSPARRDGPPPFAPPSTQREPRETAADQIARLAMSPRAVERQVEGPIFAGSEDERGEE